LFGILAADGKAMDTEFQRRIVAAGFRRLEQRIEEDRTFNVRPEWEADVLFVRMFGLGGESEPYQAKIESWLYPVGPWRVGFIDPAVGGPSRLLTPDRDPRFWPYSQLPGAFGGFHVHYPREHRVFICLPFTTEFFRYHGDHPWSPNIYDLYRVVTSLYDALKKAVHFSVWREMNYGAGR
jgi:hypothetical protein